MLSTPLFPVQRSLDCDVCRAFERAAGAADEPNWSMQYRLPALHADLEPTDQRYGIPGSGFGRLFRCRRCGTLWDVSLLCDHGLERAALAEVYGETQRSYVHHGPWTDLVDLSGLPARLSLTEYSFELDVEVGGERIHPDALAILDRHPALSASPTQRVRVEAGLQCLRGAQLTDPPDRHVRLVRVQPQAPVVPGRCTAAWRRELLDAVLERGRVRGSPDMEADSFELQTVGCYSLELPDREIAVVLSELQLFIGDLTYSSSGFMQETDLPEPYILWLFELLMAHPPVAELVDGWTGLLQRGFVPAGAVPLCNVIPSLVKQARDAYDPVAFGAWSELVLHAPGLHLFHDVESVEGDVDGGCAGMVRVQLEGPVPSTGGAR